MGPESSLSVSLRVDGYFVFGIKYSGTDQILLFVGYCYNWQLKY